VALLQQAGLPIEDLTEERLEEFFVAGDPAAPLGMVGLELSPPYGLLRSLVVEPRARSGGLGSRLLAHAEAHARSRGVRSLYLLTTTAEAFFAARGYSRADRSTAPASIQSSAEFSALCPASAAFMVKHFQE
jgi:amino-acid N-acetyltransferase